MPAKTLYVKDEQLWEKAKCLAGHQGFSRVIMQLLGKWVADKEREKAIRSGVAFTEIELWVGGGAHWDQCREDPIKKDHKIVFTGRLLDSRDDAVPEVDVYQMKSGRLVVYKAWRNYSLATDQEYEAAYKVFADYEELSRSPEALNANDGEVLSEEEKIEQTARNLQFQEHIANALGSELVVRIDQFPHVSSPAPRIGSDEASE